MLLAILRRHAPKSKTHGALAAGLMVARSRGGDLKLTAVSNKIKKLLDITTLGTIIKIKKSKAALGFRLKDKKRR